MEYKTTDLHDALQNAKVEKVNTKMETFTYKAPIELKEAADSICKTNGTTLSGYIRHCLAGLVSDYNPTTKE